MAFRHGIRGVLFDLDGTIYQGNELIEGASATLEWLRKAEIPFCFVTNTTSKPRQVVVDKLGRLGVDVPVDSIFTAPAVAHRYLLEHDLRRCYFLLKPTLLADFQGIETVDEDPQAVVIGDLGDEFSYNNLNRAFRFLLDGARFITLARNRYFHGKDGLSLDVGPFAAALEYATQQEAILIGKPAETFFHTAVESLGITPGETLMVGDDVESDVLGAQAVGLHGLAVKTGKYRADLMPEGVEAIEGVRDLPQWLEQE